MSKIFMAILAFSTLSVTVQANICDRDYYVQKAITQKLKKECHEIREDDLASIKNLTVNTMEHFSNQLTTSRKDFENLSNLEELEFRAKSLFYPKHSMQPDFDTFAELTQLKKLSLQGRFSTKSLAPLEGLVELELELDSTQGSDRLDGAEIAKKTNLKRLKISHNQKLTFASSPFGKCSTLEDLTIVNYANDYMHKADEKFFREISNIGRCEASSKSTLKRLHLSFAESYDKKLVLSNDSFGSNSQITDLYLDTMWDMASAVISKLPALKKLHFPRTRCSAIKVSHSQLESVKVGLKNYSCGQASVEVADSPMLKHLDFSDLNSTVTRIELINLPLLKTENLILGEFVRSYIFRNVALEGKLDFSNRVMTAMPQLTDVEKVEAIDASGNQIREVNLDYANYLPKELKELNLCGNPLQNPAALWNLTKGYPSDAQFKIKVTTASGCEYLN